MKRMVKRKRKKAMKNWMDFGPQLTSVIKVRSWLTVLTLLRIGDFRK